MQNVWVLASLWVGLALVATLLAIWFKISTALTEIVVGTVAQLIFGAFIVQGGLAAKSEWISFVAGTGAIVLTFLAGAELDPKIFRTKWKESTVVAWWGSSARSWAARLSLIMSCIGQPIKLASRCCSVHNLGGCRLRSDVGTRFQRHRLRKGHSGSLFCERSGNCDQASRKIAMLHLRQCVLR